MRVGKGGNQKKRFGSCRNLARFVDPYSLRTIGRMMDPVALEAVQNGNLA